jgi:site-specific DNA-cytosine methylase
MKHSSIIPLIGGETIAAMNAFGTPPQQIFTYSPFEANEAHLRHYLRYRGYDVPYVVLDDHPGSKRDWHGLASVSSVCPCAGLSFLGTNFGEHNESNQWMPRAAEFVLGELKPEVYWGENAPQLAGKVGKPILGKLLSIAREHGYSMSLYRTKSLLHGVPQIRERAFYFFWKGDRVPLLDYYDRPYQRIEDLITGITSNLQTEPINRQIPSRDDPYYRYLLEVVLGGITHREYHDLIDDKVISQAIDVKSDIERRGHDYGMVGEWMGGQGFDREVAKCDRMRRKLDDGHNIMRRGTMVPKNYIGAFVSHYPKMLTHPYEDRYINYREAMTIMGLPSDFELLDPKHSVNHICQNVPVRTAEDMATEVREYLLGNRRDTVRADLVLQRNHSRMHEVVDRGDVAGTLEALI